MGLTPDPLSIGVRPIFVVLTLMGGGSTACTFQSRPSSRASSLHDGILRTMMHSGQKKQLKRALSFSLFGAKKMRVFFCFFSHCGTMMNSGSKDFSRLAARALHATLNGDADHHVRDSTRLYTLLFSTKYLYSLL